MPAKLKVTEGVAGFGVQQQGASHFLQHGWLQLHVRIAVEHEFPGGLSKPSIARGGCAFVLLADELHVELLRDFGGAVG